MQFRLSVRKLSSEASTITPTHRATCHPQSTPSRHIPLRDNPEVTCCEGVDRRTICGSEKTQNRDLQGVKYGRRDPTNGDIEVGDAGWEGGFFSPTITQQEPADHEVLLPGSSCTTPAGIPFLAIQRRDVLLFL